MSRRALIANVLPARHERSWAETNRDVLAGFIRAYAKGVEAMCDPKNRPIVEAILVANAAGITQELAAKAYDKARRSR
jgi:hypothetical protein